MKLNIGEMTFGDILDRSFRILLSRFGTLYLIELIVLAPTLLLQLSLPDITIGPGGALLVFVPSLLLAPIGSAALLRVITQEFQGRSVGLGEAFQFALTRFLPLFGTTLLVGIGVLFGMLACIVPGVYVAILWALASQVVVAENLAGREAISRSAELVRGYFWRVFGILILLGLGVAMVNAVVTFALSGLFPHVEIVQLPNPANPLGIMRVNNFVFFAIVHTLPALVNILGQTYIATCTTLVYFDLRHRKDGFDVYAEERPADWREEEPLPLGDRPAETGIKPGDGGAPPQTGIQRPE